MQGAILPLQNDGGYNNKNMIDLKEELYDFLNSSYYGEKIKEDRKKNKLTLAEARERTGIPTATLQRYEDGRTKKIPKEAIQKFCKLYNEDESIFSSVSYIEFFNSLFPVISLTLFGMEFHKLNLSDDYYEKLGIDRNTLKKLSELRKLDQRKKLLTKEEKIEYEKFVKLAEILLDIKEVYHKEYQDILFSTFFFITLKKREKNI